MSANTQVATVTEAPKRSLMIAMSTRYGMEPAAFEATLRATVLPNACSKEHLAAFLLVAKEHGLNPVTREIYAFPTKGGGIQPIVGVDGWMRIINDQPLLDGVEFEDHLDDDGKLSAITCRIYRKDRSRPTTVTEYMSECRRNTDTWKQWPARMLRHKAVIQAARYAFGLSGIIEPDEYERGVGEGVRDITPKAPPPPGHEETAPSEPKPVPTPSVQEVEALKAEATAPREMPDIPEAFDRRKKPEVTDAEVVATAIIEDPDAYLKGLAEQLSAASDTGDPADLKDAIAEAEEGMAGLSFPADVDKTQKLIDDYRELVQ